MKKAILVEYKGKNKKLTSGKMYSWKELADAFGLSKSTVVTRLKGKGSCRDKDFELTDMRKHTELLKIKKIKFVGEKKGFETGKDYTLVELSKTMPAWDRFSARDAAFASSGMLMMTVMSGFSLRIL